MAGDLVAWMNTLKASLARCLIDTGGTDVQLVSAFNLVDSLLPPLGGVMVYRQTLVLHELLSTFPVN